MPRSRPEVLLLDYLDARERDPSLTFDAFCAKHPAEADDLRKLFLGWQIARERDLKGSLGDRLKRRFGSDADPGISLDGDPESTIDQDLLDALKARGPSSSRYRLKGEVAQGGMGVILRVWDEDLRRHLAMKVMLDETESNSSRLARFLEEAQVTGQLDHPGIVPVHELGIDANGRVYFTMKLVKGKTLEHVFDAVKHGDDGWNVTRALAHVLSVCDAMAFAHEKGVIHRDLKPSNIMVGRFGETFVMDWGLARVLGKKDTKDTRSRPNESVSVVRSSRRDAGQATPNSPLLTMDGDLNGTLQYMPPEQARGELKRIDARTDVYAVGAILYHLLSGQVPYGERAAHSSDEALLEQVLRGSPKPLHTLTKDVPAELLAICDKAMERDPDRRYASMLDLADDLRAYLERRVVKAYETGAIAEMKKWVHRNKGLAAAAAIALITLAAGAALFVRNTSLKAANAEIANKNEQLARKQDEFDLVAARIKLGNAIAIEETLYPPWPHKIEAMEKWLNGEAAELLALKPTLERTLTNLQARAGLSSNEEPSSTVSAGPLLAPQSEQFLQSALTSVLSDLPSFESRVASLRRRLAWAQRIEALTLQHPNARVTWAAARNAIAKADGIVASTLYRDVSIDLRPQMGLVPIGMNPVTKLWEFYELRSACDVAQGQDPATIEIPTHRADGSVEVEDQTGVILALLPGGTIVRGEPNRDPEFYGFDETRDGESSQAVTVLPFFLSRYELTKGQWRRLMDGDVPRNWEYDTQYRNHIDGPLNIRWTHPAESISWIGSELALSHIGLTIPTEDQWEYGARAGTKTWWWTGPSELSLLGAANISSIPNMDGSMQEGNLDDGFTRLSPVGALAANPFGLHDVHGNVWEWCQTLYDEHEATPIGFGAPLRGSLIPASRACRGGSYADSALSVGYWASRTEIPSLEVPQLGVRPSRVVN